jgi:hypothetical protein
MSGAMTGERRCAATATRRCSSLWLVLLVLLLL